MISLQSIMLVALGFLAAALIALMVAPAFWTRAVRLTTRRITDTLPITEAEIRADKDRMRAEYAMTVHRLETRIEQAELNRARHLVDLNRRDAAITELENTLTTIRSELEENQNARRVLEHTVSDRLPKLDDRLAEARRLLDERDAELARVSATTEAQIAALEEATAINTQQAAEIERLTTSLTVVGARTHNSLQDQRTDAEIALRAEIDALRARNREQTAIIARLEAAAGIAGRPAPHAPATPAIALVTVAANRDADAERREKELKSARVELTERTAELARAKAEIETLRKAAAADNKDSPLALKARIAGLETERAAYIDQIASLKAEASNLSEQLLRQSADFAEHIRRAGAGTIPAAPGGRPEQRGTPRLSLAERVAQSRSTTPRAAPPELANDDAPAPEVPALAAPETTTPTTEPATEPAQRERGRLIDRISSLNKA